MRADTITVVDNRTGNSYELPIEHGAIRTTDLRQIRTGPDDFGLLAYDPAFMNTAACKSRITFIDGDRGILEYRGHPMEQIAEHSTFLETAYLLLHGELPTRGQLDAERHIGECTNPGARTRQVRLLEAVARASVHENRAAPAWMPAA